MKKYKSDLEISQTHTVEAMLDVALPTPQDDMIQVGKSVQQPDCFIAPHGHVTTKFAVHRPLENLF